MGVVEGIFYMGRNVSSFVFDNDSETDEFLKKNPEYEFLMEKEFPDHKKIYVVKTEILNSIEVYNNEKL